MAISFANKTTSSSAATKPNDAWKAQGFINLYLPTKGGARRKLGSIPLKSSVASQKALLDWLTEKPSRADNLKAKATLDFNLTARDESQGFDLGYDVKPLESDEPANPNKAAAFLNINLPAKEGGTRKLGGIPLRAGDADEAAFMNWLASDVDGANLALLTEKIVFVFNAVTPVAGTGFDLAD